MNIKKIRWKVPGKDQGRPLVAFDDEMGLGFRVSVLCHKGIYQWRIYRGSLLMRSGNAGTADEAKATCQDVWNEALGELREAIDAC